MRSFFTATCDKNKDALWLFARFSYGGNTITTCTKEIVFSRQQTKAVKRDNGTTTGGSVSQMWQQGYRARCVCGSSPHNKKKNSM